MSWESVRNHVAEIAPSLGSLLGSEDQKICLAAQTMLVSALHCEWSSEAVETALAESPESALRLREMEIAAQVLLPYVGQVSAISNNPQPIKQDKSVWIPAMCISCVVVSGFFWILSTMIGAPNAAIGEPLAILLGSIATAFGAVVNYYLGSSSSSAQKTAMLAKSQISNLN